MKFGTVMIIPGSGLSRRINSTNRWITFRGLYVNEKWEVEEYTRLETVKQD